MIGTSSLGLGADDESSALDRAFDALPKYEWGPDRQALDLIDLAVTTAVGDATASRELESRLVAVLGSEASRAARQFVCRELAVIGSSACVPALAPLLADDDLAHMARFALEGIGDATAAGALRGALPQQSGNLKIGIIHSLGRLRDREAVPRY